MKRVAFIRHMNMISTLLLGTVQSDVISPCKKTITFLRMSIPTYYPQRSCVPTYQVFIPGCYIPTYSSPFFSMD